MIYLWKFREGLRIAMTYKAPGLDGFKPLEMADKEVISDYLRQDPPQTSELTFTNLFMWRHHYRPFWREWGGCLHIVCTPPYKAPFGLLPIGVAEKARSLEFLCGQLAGLTQDIMVCRVGQEFVDRYVDLERYDKVIDAGQSDYIYLAKDLINLAGRKFHQKKNHLNQFVKRHEFEARELDFEMVECVLDMQETWCQLKNCDRDPGLLSEDLAICEALKNFGDLDYRGLAIFIDGKVEAFALGERLNPQTAVIHVEKANPEIRGLYAAINQRSCQELWSEYKYINREQDLGVMGLRQAKLSYNPDHMVEKYILRPKPTRP